jgi:hypothetical protein
MAAVFELLRPHKRAILQGAFREEAASLELQTAKEILAEVLSIRLADVDEMIANRFEGGAREEEAGKEKGLWPQEFCLER